MNYKNSVTERSFSSEEPTVIIGSSKFGGRNAIMARKYSKAASREVETEMRHRKTKKHGEMSRKQAVAIGLSKARRAGMKAPAKRS